MNNNNFLLIRLELIWWLITAVLAATILFPICNDLPNYLFFADNLIFIVCFITFSRLLFLLRYSLIADRMYIKAAMIFLCIIIAFLLVQKMLNFRVFLDENGPEVIVGSMPRLSQVPMMNYIKTEMMLFGIGSVISCILLPFRLVWSIWRQVNS